MISGQKCVHLVIKFTLPKRIEQRRRINIVKYTNRNLCMWLVCFVSTLGYKYEIRKGKEIFAIIFYVLARKKN